MQWQWKKPNRHICTCTMNPWFCSCMAMLSLLTVFVCMHVCVWEKRHSLKNREWGRQGKQAEREFHFHGNQAVQASVPSVIQLYTDRAWHHQHCSLVCSAQESERQINTAVSTIHNPTYTNTTGLWMVYVGLWMCWWVGVLLGSIAILSAFVVHIHPWAFLGGVIKYVGCSQRMDWDQILSC